MFSHLPQRKEELPRPTKYLSVNSAKHSNCIFAEVLFDAMRGGGYFCKLGYSIDSKNRGILARTIMINGKIAINTQLGHINKSYKNPLDGDFSFCDSILDHKYYTEKTA